MQMNHFEKKYEAAIKCYIDTIVQKYGTVGVQQQIIASNVRKHLPQIRAVLDKQIIDRLVSEAFIRFGDIDE